MMRVQEGSTYQEIAEALGYASRGNAWRAVRRALDRANARDTAADRPHPAKTRSLNTATDSHRQTASRTIGRTRPAKPQPAKCWYAPTRYGDPPRPAAHTSAPRSGSIPPRWRSIYMFTRRFRMRGAPSSLRRQGAG